MMSLQEAINYKGPDENLVHESEHVKIFEIRQVVRNGCSFLLEPGELYRLDYKNGKGDASVMLEFRREYMGTETCSGLTEEALLEVLTHRLKLEHARTNNDRFRMAGCDVDEALEGLHFLRKV